MPKFEIIDAKEFHCGQILRRLRIEHREAIERVGANAHRELRALFDSSYLRKAWLVDGNLAALGGVSGSILSNYGFIWIALSNEAMKYPIALVREVKRQIDDIMTTKAMLATTIVGGDESAKRFAIFLGFHCDHDELGSPAYSKLSRRNLANYVDTTPDLRIPIGKGYIVPMGYHPD